MVKQKPWMKIGSLAIAAITLFSVACGSAKEETAPAGKPQAESGDTSAATDKSGRGGTLRIAMSAGNVPIPDQFLTEGGEGKRFVGANVYDTLLLGNAYQGDTVPVPGPGLATEWKLSDDKLTWTLKLRQNVKFHDGTTFNADAVVFALDRVMKKDFEFYSAAQAASGASNFQQVKSYKKIDDYTLEVVTKKPWAFLAYDMVSWNIPSPAAIKQWGNKDYPLHAVGTGPFKIAKYVDVMIGNEEDFTASLGFEVKGADHNLSKIEIDAFKQMIETAVKEFPNFKVAATTLRRVISATKNDWSAILWHDGKFHESRKYPELEILDRVGGGDSFASGLQFGFLEFNDAQKAVEYGAAHGALASTTPGDTSMATRKEVEKQISGGGARVVR